MRKLAVSHRTVALWLGLAISACAGAEDEGDGPDLDESESSRSLQERFLYVDTIAQNATDPDFVAVIGADPSKPDYGRFVARADMPNVGDELHHFGYSLDQDRLVVPGLFSARVHVFDVETDPARPRLVRVNENLVASSGFIVPHSVIALPNGQLAVTMIGANTGDTTPGGVVLINDRTGAFSAFFGPPATGRPAGTLGPKFMYDIDARIEANRAISTTFGPPALCGVGLDPTCLGNEVAVWNLTSQKVIQVADLGTNSGALEVRFIEKLGVRRALINTPGTSAVWLADDDDKNGVFDFQQVLGPEDGLLIPADMLLSYDNRFMMLTNWFGNTVQVFDITDPFNPALKATVDVPHPNMLRLSRDGKRLYVTNSLLTPWDNDPDFGPPRNDQYGIWLYNVNTTTGALTSVTGDDSPWVDFTNVQKKTTTGPAGPHMMFFDPSIRLEPGEH
jgi:selenium-binding protein 1